VVAVDIQALQPTAPGVMRAGRKFPLRRPVRSLSYSVSQKMPTRIDIKEVTERIEKAMAAKIRAVVKEKHWVTHYGANDIHPKHLVYWICVQSDVEKKRLESDEGLYRSLRILLDEYQYPIEGRDAVHIGFESQETVDRESGGNWWHHWK
jgi:hypothetical protein